MPSNEQKLRGILRANAAFSLLSGLTLIIAHTSLSNLMGVKSVAVLLYLGIGLVLFSTMVFHAAWRKVMSSKQVWSIVLQDGVWVVASGVIVGIEAWGLNTKGYWLIGGVAILVANFAIFQMRFLNRL